MIFSQIAACAENNVIGVNGDLPWDIPRDMQYFKETTAGHIMIMGRKTFDSFKGRLLPKRYHIVISRDPKTAAANFLQQYRIHKPTELSDAELLKSLPLYICCDLEAAMKTAKAISGPAKMGADGKYMHWPEEIFIIGGGEIYRQSLPKTDKVYLTRVHQKYDGDAVFPTLSEKEFRRVSDQKIDGNPSFTFEIYERIRN